MEEILEDEKELTSPVIRRIELPCPIGDPAVAHEPGIGKMIPRRWVFPFELMGVGETVLLPVKTGVSSRTVYTRARNGVQLMQRDGNYAAKLTRWSIGIQVSTRGREWVRVTRVE